MYMDWNCELLEHTGKFKEIHKLTSHDAVLQKAVTSCIEQQPFPRFDYETYLEKYPDVLRNWCKYKGNQKRPFPGVQELRVLEHFIIHGRQENRTAFCKNSSLHFSGFDIKEYKKVCHEAHIAKINNEIWGYNHFINRCPNAKYVHIIENNIFEERHKNMKWLQFLRNVWNSFQPWSYVVTNKLHNKDAMKMQSRHKDILANFVTFVKEIIKKTAAQPKMNPTIENISLFEIKGSSILMCSHSNLNVTAGDTIMMSNYMNTLMKNNNKITLVTPFECGETFTRNLEHKNYTIVKTNELVSLDILANKVDFLFVRNHQILDKFIGKSYLQKTFFYGLDVHLEGIAKMNNQFLGVITQSEKIKEMYIKKGIVNEKIQIVEPFYYKYDFQLPERKDNEIRLIYCGTLRDEENILEIIEEFQKIHKERPEVVLKIVYGKIHGNQEFTQKVNHYIKKGVKGITFKHNLSHKDSCYEIATSDIGICWRKNGWGDNGEVSTKVKEYELYGLEIINDMKIKVGVVTSTNKLNKIDNIIRNFKRQLYFNKKLFLVLNNNNINIDNFIFQLKNNDILYEIIIIDEKYNLGTCLNAAVKKMHEHKYDIFSKFDDDDIYEKKYLLEQVYYLNKTKCDIVGKYHTVIYQNDKNKFYKIKNFDIQNDFTNFCRGSTITYNINILNNYFDEMKVTGVDSLFIKNKKIYCTSDKNYIWVRFDDINKHTWKIDINKQYNLIELKGFINNYMNFIPENNNLNSLLNKNPVFESIINRSNSLCKKIYIIIWEDENKAKGINVDCEILYNTLTELNFNVSYLEIPLLYLKNFDASNNKILLDGDIYIFSEVCFADIYDFIFKNNKEIVCIPNIDSYSTYKPIIKDRESDFINNLKNYSKNNNFNVWCKTKQIYNWLKTEKLSNLHYTHFFYNISSNSNGNLSNRVIQVLKKNNNYILLDTGNSTTKRKYLEEILDIFITNENIPYTLLVKTTPKVYNKFFKNSKYDKKYDNIEMISELMSINDLTYIYQQCKFFIYCSKFDGYGLALSQAIRYNLFIFTFEGFPWCELLESYPRKCFVRCEQDFTKCMGVNIKGKALSQIYYKGDFNDLTNKLLCNKEKYENIINTTEELCNFVNIYNHKVFLSNINYYFQTKYNVCPIYNTTSIGVISYKNRELIFIENLMNVIRQVKDIVIYLNTSTEFIKTFLSNISNVHVTLCDTDLKSLTKLKIIDIMNKDVNFIIDDDIIYPPDYIEYTYNILKKLDEKCIYSYNGYSDNLKYPFNIKTKKEVHDDCNLGTGTLFYKKNAIKYGLSNYVNEIITENNTNNLLFCDKTFLNYCKINKIKTKIITPKHSYWLKNNPKMTYGLKEEKVKLNIYDLNNINTIPFYDCLIDYNNSLPNNIKQKLITKMYIKKSTNNKKYYNILFDESKLLLQNNQKETIRTFELNLLNNSVLNKQVIDFVQYVSFLYNFISDDLNPIESHKYSPIYYKKHYE